MTRLLLTLCLCLWLAPAPAQTITTSSPVPNYTGPTAWTPTDASGAALVFTGVAGGLPPIADEKNIGRGRPPIINRWAAELLQVLISPFIIK